MRSWTPAGRDGSDLETRGDELCELQGPAGPTVLDFLHLTGHVLSALFNLFVMRY